MIKANGKLRHIETQIHFAYACETDPPDFDYGSAIENQAELNRFKRGELLNLCLKVSASALGETGTDYLSQCFVLAQGFEQALEEIAIAHDMKNRARTELRDNILFQWSILNEALN